MMPINKDPMPLANQTQSWKISDDIQLPDYPISKSIWYEALDQQPPKLENIQNIQLPKYISERNGQKCQKKNKVLY